MDVLWVLWALGERSEEPPCRSKTLYKGSDGCRSSRENDYFIY